MRILIADDDFTSRKMLAAVLEGYAHEVVETADGFEAWNELQKPEAPHVVILDWLLPGIDSLELTRRLRKKRTEVPPFILILTSRGDKAEVVAGLDAGVDDYLAKPFDPEELRARVDVGRRMIQNITDRLEAEKALRESEQTIRKKLQLILEPDGNVGGMELPDLIDPKTLQSLLDDFYQLTAIGCSIVDLSGKILAAVGWQEICTHFHRVHPETRKKCIESDIFFPAGTRPGEFRTYRCKNNLWNMVTPIVVGDAHIANLFLGQVFIGQDPPDIPFFREQARRYGFDENKYLAALEAVPRWSTAKARKAMNFYIRFTAMISSMGMNNLKLAQALSERNELLGNLKQSEAKFRALVDQAAEMLFLHDLNGKLIDVNQAAVKQTGYTKEELLTMNVVDIDLHAVERKDSQRLWAAMKPDNAPETFETIHIRKDGSTYPVEITVSNIFLLDGIYTLALARDITDRKLAEEERRKLQDQILQSQKMESIGRLAGGVAHDFNNMLGVILGQAEIAMLQTKPHESVYERLQEIRKSAKRSADLTRQLLAFARKQTASPKVLNLNDTVSGMLKILRRLIGENIELRWVPGNDLWMVKMDPAQIDQILANLCINARDAISGTGKMTIETHNAVFNSAYKDDNMGFIPGEFVILSVSDDGCGMEKDALDKLFEPFFTTKEAGKGTGLGLATVYGIIKQNNGFINVYSEPGRGTTFKIYVPRHSDKGRSAHQKMQPAPVLHGSETVLLVEDEPMILRLGMAMLEHLGYRVLTASGPEEAIQTAEKHPEAIDLLITDVVMPGMDGRELSEKLTLRCPGIKCLYMSGYTADVIARHGVLDQGVHFIQKPFSIQKLATEVRKAIEEEQ